MRIVWKKTCNTIQPSTIVKLPYLTSNPIMLQAYLIIDDGCPPVRLNLTDKISWKFLLDCCALWIGARREAAVVLLWRPVRLFLNGDPIKPILHIKHILYIDIGCQYKDTTLGLQVVQVEWPIPMNNARRTKSKCVQETVHGGCARFLPNTSHDSMIDIAYDQKATNVTTTAVSTYAVPF